MVRKVAAVIPAAGIGERFGSDKLLVNLSGEPVLKRTLGAFYSTGIFSQIVVAVNREKVDNYTSLVREWEMHDIKVVEGGSTRWESVENGLNALDSDTDIIAVHDGARPLVSRDIIERSIEGAERFGAVVVGYQTTDTVKEVVDGVITKTPDRSRIFAVQTPQTFKVGLLKRAYEHAHNSSGFAGVTDDASLVERLGESVHIIEGDKSNIKITYPHDVKLAEHLTREGNSKPGDGFRVGFGYDIHGFEPGKPLVLGGVQLPGDGLKGHSDADVLLHALTDAILGAIGERDIGYHFPPNDDRFKNSKSTVFIEKALDLARQSGWKVHNADITLVAERPKMTNYIDSIKDNLSGILGIERGRIALKAKTNEGMGPIGEGKGIASFATVIISGD